MKHIVKNYYECEKCGRRFECEEAALKCEKSHLSGVFVGSKYLDHVSVYPTYPFYIYVRFDNGEKRRYKFDLDYFYDVQKEGK